MGSLRTTVMRILRDEKLLPLRVYLWRPLKAFATQCIRMATAPSDYVRARVSLRSAQRLHLGSGDNAMKDWTNIDLGGGAGTVRWNLTTALPVKPSTVSFVYSEHFIEHITRAQAVKLLRECHQALKPGGVLRLSTPDLEFLVQQYLKRQTREWANMQFLPETPCQMVNDSMRLWEHQFLYDWDELSRLLAQLGFSAIRPRDWGQSDHPELRNLECRPFHHELILEAVKS